jgi:hypothetical protein
MQLWIFVEKAAEYFSRAAPIQHLEGERTPKRLRARIKMSSRRSFERKPIVNI